MHKAFLQNLFAQQPNSQSSHEAYAALIAKSTEIFMGDPSELPMNHAEMVQNLQLAAHIPADFSFLADETAPFPSMLFTWSDETLKKSGFRKNLLWCVAEVKKPTATITLGAVLWGRVGARIFTSGELASILFQTDGIHLTVNEEFRKSFSKKPKLSAAYLQIFFYALLYAGDFLKKACLGDEIVVSAANACCVFRDTIGKTARIPNDFVNARVDEHKVASCRAKSAERQIPFDEIDVVGATPE